MRTGSVSLLAALALAVPATAAAATIHGTPRDDRIDVVGRGPVRVVCGAGRDIVTADQSSGIARDCEVVSRRISVDTLASSGGQHQTEVEPDVAANGSTAVAVFQVGRIPDGGAAGIGWATSTNAGRTWRSGMLPGVTTTPTTTGVADRASDPAVTYDAAHGVWLAATLIIGTNLTALGISRSRDGLTWSAPVLAAQIQFASLGYDKEWISCDNDGASPFRGSCYLVYTDILALRLSIQVSHDGGQTWSAGATVSTDAGADAEGALPLVQPDGALTIVFDASDAGYYAVRSVDGGATFAPRVGIAPVSMHNVSGLRAPPLPTATVDASGKLYVAWSSCAFRAVCAGNDIVFSSSTDGVAWTLPKRIPGTGAESFVPGIAADPDVPGRLGVVTYLLTPAGRIGVSVTTSRDGGATWTKAQRLDALSPLASWLAEASGRFVGDYVGATFAAGRFVAVFVLAHPRVKGSFSEYMMATSLP